MAEQTTIFETAGEGVGMTSEAMTRRRDEDDHEPQKAREDFLTGMFATWAASDRGGPGTAPVAEEKRRAREAAREALGVMRR